MTALIKIDAYRSNSSSGPALVEAGVDAFRAAMRQLAEGVCLVTQGVGAAPTGMTATSVTSLALDPPTLIVCVNRASSSYSGLARGVAFGVSVLGADHIELAERFSGRTGEKGADRFREGNWLIGPGGAPLLRDALAAFDCVVEELVERHTHAIVIGRVKRTAVGAGGGALVHWRGHYDQLGWSLDEVSRATGRSPTAARE
jgi:flavin reductase (DIM6/NTAB) family NADH-FMN oxidoreductase RutF